MNIEKELMRYDDFITKSANRVKYSVACDWADRVIEDAGVYAFYYKRKIIYIGESRSLKARMKDLRRTVNHTFRRKFGNFYFEKKHGFEKATSKRKFPEHIEEMVNKRMESMEVVLIPIAFGRSEVEDHLIKKYKPKFNSNARRGNA